jgi:hypothetical protein
VTTKVMTTITPQRKETRMNPPLRRLRRTAVATALAAAGLAAAASPALAAPGFSITVTGPESATVGKTILLTASGQNPTPAESWFNSYLEVNAIPTSVIASCPSEYLQGTQIAQASASAGGKHLAGPQVEVRDTDGTWSAPVAFTPSAAGKMLICAYSENLTNTLAVDQHVINVQGGKGKAAKKCRKGRRGGASAAKRCRNRR